MLIHKTVKPGKVILIVDDLGLRVLIRGELHKILSLLLAELNTRSLQVPLHLLDLNIPLIFRVQKSKSGKDSLRLIRLELLLLQNYVFLFVPRNM